MCQKKIPSWVTYEIGSTKLSRDLHACVLTVSRDLAISLSFAFRWRTTLRKFSFNFLAGMNGEAIQHTAPLQKVRMILERLWFWFILRLFLCCLTIFHRTSLVALCLKQYFFNAADERRSGIWRWWPSSGKGSFSNLSEIIHGLTKWIAWEI